MATNQQDDEASAGNDKKPAFNVSVIAPSTTTFENNDDNALEETMRNKILGSKYNLKSFLGTKVQQINNNSLDGISQKKMQYVNTVYQMNCKDVAKKNALDASTSTINSNSIVSLQTSLDMSKKQNHINELQSPAMVCGKNGTKYNGNSSRVTLQTSLDMSKKQNLINELQSPAMVGGGGKNGTNYYSPNGTKKTAIPTKYDEWKTKGEYDENEKYDGKQDMAVAFPVSEVITNEESDDMFLPAAIEFDPDKKKSTDDEKNRCNKRKFIIITILANVIITSITIGVMYGIMKHQYDNKNNCVPVHPRLNIGILQFLQSQFPLEEYKFHDPTTSFAKAMHWMTYNDPQLLTPYYNKTFLQRFILVQLYYKTSQTNDWIQCIEHRTNYNDYTNTTNGGEECVVYKYGKWAGVDISRPSAKLWMSQYNECDWVQNTCDSLGNIVSISLGLNGRFPNELNRLVFLNSLHLSVNNITATLPPSMQFKYLHTLSVADNQLVGDVPILFYQQSRLLRRIYFEYNQFNEIHFNHLPTDVIEIRFDGSNYSQALVDTQIERLPSLGIIDMSNTNLLGEIPLSLWNLPLISTIELSRNFLTGRLPQQPVPATVTRVHLAMNQISGSIPDAFVSSTDNKIDILLLNGNKLEGSIPSNINNLKKLNVLSLENNKGLYGTIPSEMGKMSSLMSVSFVGTSVNRSIPIELCNLRDIFLSSLKADCLADKKTGVVQISCPDGCCTTCCNIDGEQCIEY